MSKLRSDSIFTQLTSEQTELLEDWLFEEKLGYKEVLAKMEQEFGVKPSQSGLGRFYRRLAGSRTQELRLETMAICIETLATAKNDGKLEAGLMTLANLLAAQYISAGTPTVSELISLLKALTSAQTLELKRADARAAEERHQQSERERQERKAEEARKAEVERFYQAQNREVNREIYQKRQATIAAKKKAAEEAAALAKAKAQTVKPVQSVISHDEGQMPKKDDAGSSVGINSPQSSTAEAEKEKTEVLAATTNVPAVVAAMPKVADKPVVNEPAILDLAEYARVTGRDACADWQIDPNRR